jgi:hypothetical protein
MRNHRGCLALRRYDSWQRRGWQELSRWSRGSSPDQPTAIFLTNMGMGKKNFFSQVREIVIIHVKATFDGPIGYPPLALDQCQDLLQQFVKIHDASSPMRIARAC